MGSGLGWLPARIFGKANGEGARMDRCAVNVCPVAVLSLSPYGDPRFGLHCL